MFWSTFLIDGHSCAERKLADRRWQFAVADSLTHLGAIWQARW